MTHSNLKYKIRDKLLDISNFGEGEYEELEWVALFLTTFGVGVIPMVLARKLARKLLKSKYVIRKLHFITDRNHMEELKRQQKYILK